MPDDQRLPGGDIEASAEDALAIAAEAEGLAANALAPVCFGTREALRVEVFQSRESPGWETAARSKGGLAYKPVKLGWRWGPLWSSAWFRLSGSVPEAMAGREVLLRFDCGTEALLWRDGQPVHGLDANRDLAPVERHARARTELVMLVEASCNRPLGGTTFFFDEPAEVERWKEAKPGWLRSAELVVRDAEVWEAQQALLQAARLVRLAASAEKPRPARAAQLGAALRHAMESLRGDAAAVRKRAAEAKAGLLAAIRDEGRTGGVPEAERTDCIAVGHAHIDTAWLWTTKQTRRKCLRTFSTALELLDRHPAFRFIATAAQHYEWVKQDAPGLFQRIAEQVRAGRWEAAGGTWVEPDCNLISGESLIRQIIHGGRWWREQFGHAAPQSYLYLPDTFGFPPHVPQIMAQAGLSTFVFNKLSWNETNEFPHATFWWRGLDGTVVLAHATPGLEYNSTITPAELRKGDDNERRKDAGRTGVWLQPFGYGDGGGGPTEGMIRQAELADTAPEMPRVRFGTIGEFCGVLHERTDDAESAGRVLPVREGELYLERHRGTYTTQASLKQCNRDAENEMRMVEAILCAAPKPADAHLRTHFKKQLGIAWRSMLLCQFHDILPGTSIHAVTTEALAAYEQVFEVCRGLLAGGLARWVATGASQGLAADPNGLVGLNETSHEMSGTVIDREDRLWWVQNAPAMGLARCEPTLPAGVPPVTVGERWIDNGLVRVEIDDAGRIVSLKRRGLERDVAAEATAVGRPLNQLVLYDDTPEHWEAWDIAANYAESARPVVDPAEAIEVMPSSSNMTQALVVLRPIGSASSIMQQIRLFAGSPVVSVTSTVSWRENRTLLRALFPTTIHADEATYDVSLGHIRRPTHTRTPAAAAMFEVCAHTWADLSEPGLGLSLLNTGKYGHSCRDGVLGLSLLRSTKFPSAEADMGQHEFTYGLLPHDGDWRTADVDRHAERLNRGLRCIQGFRLDSGWSPVAVGCEQADARIEIAALKFAEDDEDSIALRLVETRGAAGGPVPVVIKWNIAVAGVFGADVLERPDPAVILSHDGAAGVTRVSMRPFGIVTLVAKRV